MGKPKGYEFVFFDWDGCLAKTLQVWLQSFRDEYNHSGLQPSDHAITSRFGHWDKAAELGVPEHEVAAFNKAVRSVAETALLTVDLYPGAHELLLKLGRARIAEHIKGFGLLTGSYIEAVCPSLSHHGLVDTFDAVISKSDGLGDKPDPEGIYVLLERMGMDSAAALSRVVLIGDTDKDILAAHNAGVDSIWMSHLDNNKIYGSEQMDYFRSLGPTYEASSFSELEALLQLDS